jgi:hypothetical protein
MFKNNELIILQSICRLIKSYPNMQHLAYKSSEPVPLILLRKITRTSGCKNQKLFFLYKHKSYEQYLPTSVGLVFYDLA